MSKECETKVKVDSSEAEEALKQLEDHTAMSANEIFMLTRKTYSTLALLGDILGYAIPQWINMMLSAAMMAVETYTALATAEFTTGNIVKAVLSFSAATLLFGQALQIATMATQTDAKLNSVIQLLNMWS